MKNRQKDYFMNNDRLKFRTPYYLPNPDGINEFVGFAHWDAITGRPNMMVVWDNDEQCTGLKDKNGNLIYEGDLVKIPDDWDEYGWMAGEVREIYYKDGGFRFKPKEASIKRGERGHWLEDDGCYEIVGNIHERKDKQ